MTKPIRMQPTGNPDTGFVPSNLVAEADFTTADKTELISPYFANKDNTLLAGVWKCAPTRETFDAYPANEMMTVISGSVTLTSPDGTAQTFTAGDTFFMVKGTPCTWEITETLTKHYMISV